MLARSSRRHAFGTQGGNRFQVGISELHSDLSDELLVFYDSTEHFGEVERR